MTFSQTRLLLILLLETHRKYSGEWRRGIVADRYLFSSSRLTLVPLNPSWSFDMAGTMDFPGAHGDEIVRDFLIDNHVRDNTIHGMISRLTGAIEPASDHVWRRRSSPSMGTRSTTLICFGRRNGHRQEKEAQRQEEEGEIQPILGKSHTRHKRYWSR